MYLLVGGDSEIGAATARHMRARGLAVTTTTRRADRDAADMVSLDLSRSLDGFAPPAGTQAAGIFVAIARIAACENDPAGSAHVNVTQTLALTETLLARGTHVLFLSTDKVFDGRTPHVPADAPASPATEYGRQKARTEAALRARMERGEPVAILRLAKVVSPDMALVRGWVDALRAGQPIRAFDDMTMAPTPTALVAEAITRLLQDRARGIFQLTGPRDVSYAEVGLHLADKLGADRALVERISARSMGQPAGATPGHTTLDSSALKERYGLAAPDVWDVIAPFVAHR